MKSVSGEEAFCASCAELTVIVPYYQEAETLHLVVTRMLTELPELRQVIVVDDGSTSRPAGGLPRDHRILHLRHAFNRGKGAALRTALAVVNSKYVALQDADLEYDPSDIRKMLHILRATRSSAVVGTRRGAPGWERARFDHRWGNFVLTWLFNWAQGTPFTDVTAGTKVFERDALDCRQLREQRWGTDVEILARLIQWGPTREVPISYWPRTLREGKKIRPWHAFEILRSIWAASAARPAPRSRGIRAGAHDLGSETRPAS